MQEYVWGRCSDQPYISGQLYWAAVSFLWQRFFSPVPFRVWTAKKYSLNPCEYRRNVAPPMKLIGKEKYGWNANGLPFQMRDNGGPRKISPLLKSLSIFHHRHPKSSRPVEMTTIRRIPASLALEDYQRVPPQAALLSASDLRPQTSDPSAHDAPSVIPCHEAHRPQRCSSCHTV